MMTRAVRRRVVAASCLAVPVVLAIALHDGGVVRAASDSLDRDVERLKTRQVQLNAARRRAADLREELRRSSFDLLRLQQILPYGLDVDSFRRELERLGVDYGVEVQEDSASFEQEGRLIVANMHVLIRGVREARRPFLQRLSKRARQCVLEVLEVREDHLRGKLTFWAWDPARPTAAPMCRAAGSRMAWTPWARARIETKISACLALLDETRLVSDLEGDLVRYEFVKAEVGDLVDQINETQRRNTEIWKKVLAGSL